MDPASANPRVQRLATGWRRWAFPLAAATLVPLALLGADPGFENLLGELPEGVRLRRRAQGRNDVILLFAG